MFRRADAIAFLKVPDVLKSAYGAYIAFVTTLFMLIAAQAILLESRCSPLMRGSGLPVFIVLLLNLLAGTSEKPIVGRSSLLVS